MLPQRCDAQLLQLKENLQVSTTHADTNMTPPGTATQAAHANLDVGEVRPRIALVRVRHRTTAKTVGTVLQTVENLRGPEE